MVEISAGQLVEVCDARFAAGVPQRICRGCVIDSRRVEVDSLFVAFPGERVDGNDFALAALEAGAGAVAMTREPADDVIAAAVERDAAVLVVDDATEFLLRLAAWYRTRLSAAVIGITGSIGKTTTKDVLCALLATRFRVHVTRGNLNNLIGMPLTILEAPADTEMLVLEMGMNHLHEIERLSACARPDVSVITKVGTSHVGILGSRENIARAKAEILTGMTATAKTVRPSRLVIAAEDDFASFICDNFAAPAGVDVLFAGLADADTVRAENVEVGEDGCPVFTLVLDADERVDVKLSIMGAQAVPNAVYAAAIAHLFGISGAAIASAFGRLQVTGRRQEIRRAACGARVVDDTYNAAPESMAAGLDLLCTLPCEESRVAVLGEMGELGEEAERLHALVGSYAAAKKLDFIAFVGGENAQAMAEAAVLMGADEDRTVVVADWREALDTLGPVLQSGDLALVKGSRFVELDRFVEGVC